MLTQHLALVAATRRIGAAELAAVAAALGKQAARDFAPIWGTAATVAAFPTLRDVPAGYLPVSVHDDIGEPGAGGYHTDEHGQPYSLVQWSPDWSVTASHEVLEMLADPFGSRMVAGDSPVKGQGRVRFLVEVADPCEAVTYTVNGVAVSDFVTPQFFDPSKTTGARYSFTGAVTAPRQVLKGGYLSWLDARNEWWQRTWFGGRRAANAPMERAELARSRRATPRGRIDAAMARRRPPG